jgi:L-fucose isomerase-like protein
MAVFGLIVGARGGFPDHLVETGRKRILEKLTVWGHKVLITEESKTSFGGVKTFEDAQITADFFRAHSKEIEGILITLPNFGDEGSITEAVRLSGLRLPILVQADSDKIGKLGVEERGGAYCGKLSVCNNLYQNDIPFTNTSTHTCDLDDPAFAKDVERFARVCKVVNKLRNARLGAIGSRPAPFNTLRYSEKLFMQSGIFTVTEDLLEIFGRAQAVSDSDRIKKTIEEMKDYVNIPASVPSEVVERLAKFDIVLKDWVKDHQIDVTAVQCWNSPYERYGCAVCTSMAMLSSAGIPSACEMDMGSAVSMLALQQAAEKPAFCEDWYVPYHDDSCVCIHCSNFAKEVFEEKPIMGANCVAERNYGTNNCTGALKGKVATGPMTCLKLTTDDKNGKIKAVVSSGKIIEGNDVKIYSPHVVCQIPKLEKLMDYLCKNGFEHHFAMVQADVADEITEALSTYMGWEVYRHG